METDFSENQSETTKCEAAQCCPLYAALVPYPSLPAGSRARDWALRLGLGCCVEVKHI
ncbi:Hypothetical protein J6898_02835 [Nakaseomyces glabratus]